MRIYSRQKKQNLSTVLLLAFFLLLSAPVSAQETEWESVDNWLYENGDRQIWQSYKSYSKQDVTEARAKFELIKAARKDANNDNWSGIFEPLPYPELGVSQLVLDANEGFVNFYVYTCQPELRSLDYGAITDEPSVIWLNSERADNPRRPKRVLVKYVKVKWGEKHLLIEEEDLADFINRVTGLEVSPENQDENAERKWLTVWAKAEDQEKPLTGLPVLPYEYEHLLRRPLEAKIIAVGKRTIEKTKVEWSDEPEIKSRVTVKINLGSKHGVQKGMTFRILENDETIRIESVKGSTSFGAIIREIDENNRESYYDNEAEREKVYRKVSIGWRLTTAPTPASVNLY